jgi:hypothetical protein
MSGISRHNAHMPVGRVISIPLSLSLSLSLDKKGALRRWYGKKICTKILVPLDGSKVASGSANVADRDEDGA